MKPIVAVLLFLSAALLPAASVTVTAPSGGTLDSGAPYVIRWTHSADLTAASLVRLILFRGTTKIGEIAASVPVTQKSFNWTVGRYSGGTAPAGDGYLIRLKAMDGSYTDDGAAFAIRGGGQTITAPGGGNFGGAKPEIKFTWIPQEFYNPGNHVQLTWKSSGPVADMVDISLQWGEMMASIKVAQQIPNNGSFTWTFPKNIPHMGTSTLFHFFIMTRNKLTNKYVYAKSSTFHIQPGMEEPSSQFVAINAQTMNGEKLAYWEEEESEFQTYAQSFPNPGPGKARIGYSYMWHHFSFGEMYTFYYYRSWVHFDLSSLPAGKSPVSCRLNYTIGSGGGMTAGACFDVRFYQLTAPFNGDPGSLYTTQAYDPQKIDLSDSARLLSIVNGWRTNPGANYGLMVVGCEEGATSHPHSTEYSVQNLENLTLRFEYK